MRWPKENKSSLHKIRKVFVLTQANLAFSVVPTENSD